MRSIVRDKNVYKGNRKIVILKEVLWRYELPHTMCLFLSSLQYIMYDVNLIYIKLYIIIFFLYLVYNDNWLNYLVQYA